MEDVVGSVFDLMGRTSDPILEEEIINQRVDYIFEVNTHSSEIRGLYLMKRASKMLQNLPYLWNTKTYEDFCFSFRVTLFFPLLNALVYINTDQGACIRVKIN